MASPFGSRVRLAVRPLLAPALAPRRVRVPRQGRPGLGAEVIDHDIACPKPLRRRRRGAL
jgi:hypothetical protein